MRASTVCAPGKAFTKPIGWIRAIRCLPRVARRFMELYTQAYGTGEFYLADAFNEMLPPVADDGSDVAAAKYGDSIANSDAARAKAVPPAQRDARLAEYGQALYRSIAQVNPKATWVMQGWLFGADREFWQPQAIAAFLGKVPDARLLVLDIGNDRYPGTWKASQAFDNKQWIYGYVHNYGASNPLYGDFAFYRQDLQALLADSEKRNLRGFGIFPEGLHSNSVVYEYLYALAWEGPQPAVVAVAHAVSARALRPQRCGLTERMVRSGSRHLPDPLLVATLVEQACRCLPAVQAADCRHR